MTISTYYEPVECEVCGSQTNYVEAIAIKTASVVNYGSWVWHRVCPRCYAEADRQLKEENE